MTFMVVALVAPFVLWFILAMVTIVKGLAPFLNDDWNRDV